MGGEMFTAIILSTQFNLCRHTHGLRIAQEPR